MLKVSGGTMPQPWERRVIGKVEVMKEGENPRFIVSHLPAQGFAEEKDESRFRPARLYEELYGARGSPENLRC